VGIFFEDMVFIGKGGIMHEITSRECKSMALANVFYVTIRGFDPAKSI
jgi:hypothetical protein